MKKITGYENAKVFTENQVLPPGGYIIGILSAEEIEYSWGSVLEVKFDIAEGEHRGFYTSQYKNSQLEDKKYKGTYRMNIPKEDGSEMDEWTIRKFKSDIIAIEESNPGFRWTWDEKQLGGKKVGAIFFEREYDFNGKQGFYTTVHSLRNIQAIRDNKYKIPNPKLLKNKPAETIGFTEIDDDDELPFM